MPVIRILPHAEYCPQGDTIEAERGTSICEALLEHGIAIEHACEKVGACATCHVYLRVGADQVAPADEDEEDELDNAWGLDGQSRLSCCVRVKGPRLVVELPRYSKNHAREH